MKKFIMIILGLFSLAGTAQLIFAMYLLSVQLILVGEVADDDSLEISAWTILPTIFSSYLLYRLIKDPSIFNSYKRTFSYFSIGIIGTIVVGLVFSWYVLKSDELMGFLVVIAIVLIGFLVSICISILGYIMDRRNIT